MYKEIIKIPKERIAVLIGKKGSIKRELERIFGIRITVNSETGQVFLESEESINLFESVPAIKAIARGFNPKYAESLKNEDTILEVINIEEFARKTKGDLVRIRARLIGKEGKARQGIEQLTNTHICVYGKTVAILGKYEDVKIAKEGIEDLLKGAPHSNAFRHITNRKKDVEPDNY